MHYPFAKLLSPRSSVANVIGVAYIQISNGASYSYTSLRVILIDTDVLSISLQPVSLDINGE